MRYFSLFSSQGESRLSTPSLTSDGGSEATEASVPSQAPSPSPDGLWAGLTRGTLTSHTKCVEYLATAHPGAEVVDLNAPLPEIPSWSYECLRLPSFLDVHEAEIQRQRCTLSVVQWDESDSDLDEGDDDAEGIRKLSPAPSSQVPLVPLR